ncbi:HXXEE domain-containing protein [Clostridium estertheticum]|uniref:HXXEE domain-containing protein n=1 Tax=Clostridium estertheticum TaxID=238834 RepID=UPI001CF47FEB|nr:HXXEE domain-containing protein [Clostridium estertheticum]MCB2309388.1 HXXEE domain-containing protein [Clostridium estertheticum]MCB2347835.1 HXXEE domain-containing protein [Clostridium estertheticum]MCB2352347.1 HXXEE domain-containing protein [Clostridium estertheticum]WAG48319.1 HXXEE domain-containing protein [Clostridium estertheticum]
MNELKWFVWLFPLLFIVHDMEEIITAKHWCAKGFKQYISLPITPFGGTKNTAGFAIGVYEELILWIIATVIGNISGFYGLWYGLLVSNIVHLILFHIILLPLSYHHYVPGEITAWLTVIPCCYILNLAQNILGYSAGEVAIWVTIGIVFGFVNMKILHKNINRFARLEG